MNTFEHRLPRRPMFRTALRFVEQIARDGSMRKAAENLHIASSAVNRQLLALEEELGVQLFERLPRGVRPSAAGEVLLAWVRRWDQETTLLHQQLDVLQHGAGGTVRIASTEAIIEAVLPSVIARIRSRMPRISFDLETGDTHWVVAQMRTQEADVGIAFNPTPTRGVRVLGSLQYRIGVVMPPDHPLAKSSALTLDDCAPFPLILPSEQWLAGSVLRDTFSSRAGTLNVVARVSRSSAIRALARSGVGLAFLSPMEVEYEVQRNLLKYVPLLNPQTPIGHLRLLVPSRASATGHTAFAVESLRQAIFENENERDAV